MYTLSAGRKWFWPPHYFPGTAKHSFGRNHDCIEREKRPFKARKKMAETVAGRASGQPTERPLNWAFEIILIDTKH
ncbi:hypothetical protein BpHYR1_016479 [Brachionus plicatilis]|uniref:Uncharacterized protein n=1 Tax=Brachionus plicatilis TaxID=10195 RepID=A0A3M7RU99_BRAPC|nr:hypothetical protein BpHYR1_016479 [Brachionus plicatilis]